MRQEIVEKASKCEDNKYCLGNGPSKRPKLTPTPKE